MLQTNKALYLSHALELKPEEVALIREFALWLPENVIDCHAHSNLPDHVESMAEKTYRHMLSTFPSYSLEESRRGKELLYPGKRVRTLRFAKTFRGVNHRKANRYLLERSPAEDRIALFGLPEDVPYTTNMLRHPRVSALKMYYSYVEPTATKIYEFFKPEILAVAQELDIPIILHLPFIITKSRGDLHQLIRDFPRLRIAVAHLGLTKFLVDGLEDAFKEFVPYSQVSFDTALCPSAEVAELALRIFGSERVMFGSDEPLHFIRSRAYLHPEKGQRIITEYPYHWVDPAEHAEYFHLAKGAVHCHWLSMNALKTAISAFPEAEQEVMKRGVFCDNAARFFGF